MDTHDLVCFREVYTEHSMNKAAKKLFITSQGLGKVIQNLEHELNTQLFIRSTRGIEPTEAADTLYASSARLFEEFSAVQNSIKQLVNSTAQLKIQCSRGVLSSISIQPFLDFEEKNPDLDVSWREVSNFKVKRAVAAIECDAGLVVGHTENPHVSEEFLARREIHALVYRDHPLYRCRSVSLDMLKNEPIIILSEDYEINAVFEKACNAAGFKPTYTYFTEDFPFLYKLCVQGQGIGIVVDFSLDKFQMKGLKEIPFKEPLYWDIYQIYRADSKNYSNIERFRKHMLQTPLG